ncbi:MAG TPA: ABC transporter substrate-binding protein [Gaiellaceae bacterium]|jgi:branched-chain amino acid transport system substrate-binding protein|nr:ABC transporter substrate-binding protein [Gaiellaceae bacterium]
MTKRVSVVAALGVLGSLLVFASVGAAAGHAKHARHAKTPGVTKKTVVIGGTFPLTGPAQLYGVIPKAENAYYQWVNAHGGVNGRKIVFKYLDDQYNPAMTVPLTHKLVQQDHIFADVNSLGTAPNIAIRPYLNKQKVPQVLVATGDSYWGAQYKKYPWTIGFQPDYPGEAKIYGKWIHAHMPNAKIAVLRQDDSYGQNYYDGLRAGLGSSKSNIVDVETYPATQTDVSAQVAKLAQSGATIFALFAIPQQTIDALVVATKIGWKPTTFINNVSASPVFMSLAVKSGANVDGDISTTYLLDVVDQPNSSSAKLYKKILARYDKGANPLDLNNAYGVAVGWTFVQALKAAGKNPTRAGLMKALTHIKRWKNPFLYPGIHLHTTPKDRFMIQQQKLVRWRNQHFVPFAKLFNHAK